MIDKWDVRFNALAYMVATWSKDPERRVGAVVIDADHRVVGVGFNGLPRGVEDTGDRLEHVETRLLMSVHAEVNAILNSAPGTVEGATLYCTSFPCAACAGVIIQAGITRIVGPPPDQESSWAASWEVAAVMMLEAGIQIDEPGK